MIQFFVPDIKDRKSLPKEESGHAVRVLRHKEGDHIFVTDGHGYRHECCIISADPKEVAVEIVNSVEIAKFWPCRITLAVAPTKNMDRIEWMVEKAVEMGVDEIVPILCNHSERKVLKIERLQKIAVSAMKQSLKAICPEIRELTPFREFVATCKDGGKFMGYCDKAYPLKSLECEYQAGEDVTILIGPEGDFSAEEVKIAVAAGFVPSTFSRARLRTETAGIYAVAAIHTINQLAACRSK